MAGYDAFSTLTPWQNRLGRQMSGWLSGQIGQGVSPWQGPFAPEMSAGQLQTQQRLMELAQQQGGSNAGMMDALNRLLNAQPAQTISPENVRQYYEQNILAPTQRHMRTELPKLGEQFVGSGTFWGAQSPRAQAQSQFVSDQMQQAQEVGGQLAYQALEAQQQAEQFAQQAQLQALGLAPGVTGAPIQQTLALQEGLSLPMQLEREALMNEMQQWFQTQPQNNPALQFILGLIGTPAMGITQSDPSTAYQVLSALGGLAGGVSGFF